MKSKIISLLLLLGCTAAAAQTTVLQERFVAELTDKSLRVETIACDFTETRHMKILANDLVREGEFRYKRPARMSLDFASGDRILMTEEEFLLRADGRTTVARMNSNPMLRQMRSVFGACMTGDIGSLMKDGEMEVTPTGEGYRVRIVPSARSARKYVSAIVLDFDRKDMTLDGLCMEQPSGDYTRYTFRNKRLNLPLDDTCFLAR